MLRRTFFATGCAIAFLIGNFGHAAAETYPSKPIEFIVPWAPGGGSDVLMRLVAGDLAKQLGQPVPVINMPGVSGTAGLKDAVKRKPDGYTIAQIHDGLPTAHHTGLTSLNWDSFVPVGQITSSPQYLVVHASSPWKTLDDFVKYAKENPKKVKFGVTLGGVPHLHGAMIEEATGAEFSYVGYEGTSERVRGVLGKTVDAAIADIASANEFVKNGDLRFLAIGSDERMAQTPDVPTFKESGYDIELDLTRGIVVPKGTPQERIKVLEQALAQTAKNPELISKFRNAGAEVAFRDSEAYSKSLAKLDDAVKRLVKKLQL